MAFDTQTLLITGALGGTGHDFTAHTSRVPLLDVEPSLEGEL